MLPIDGIFGFNGEYRFLSNFYPSMVRFDGDDYPTVEHAYQAAKTFNPHEREYVRTRSTPAAAKRAGKEFFRMRPDWDDVKVQIMESLLRHKFVGYHDLSRKLYKTEDKYIEETNTWGDTFWGVCNGKGQNVLGNLLMKVRNEIRPLYIVR